jgi:Arc/MetJ-type ribon-helix-helix transcriptional regulator
MNITIQGKLEEHIAERVRCGEYESAEKLIEEAVMRLLAEDEEELQEIREKLQHAEEQITRGEYTDYDERNIRQLADRVKAAGRTQLASGKRPAHNDEAASRLS